jgi:hypothetical protein
MPWRTFFAGARVGFLSVAAVALVAGCGGQSGSKGNALRQDAAAVQSLAAEGGMLAGTAASSGSTAVFTRVHADYLGKSAGLVASRAATQESGSRSRRLARLAARVQDDLGRLSRSGDDRGQQRRLQRDLTAAANAAARLIKPT